MEHEILMIREIPAACNSDRELGKVRPKRVFVSGESGPFSGHPSSCKLRTNLRAVVD